MNLAMDAAMLWPTLHLRAYTKRYPDVWRAAERTHQANGRPPLPRWPKWCYLPLAAMLAYLDDAPDLDRIELVQDAVTLSTLAAWRVGKTVFRFHPALFESLSQTEPPKKIPTEALLHLPVWGAYVEMPLQRHYQNQITIDVHGFFAHLEYDTVHHDRELRLLFDLTDRQPDQEPHDILLPFILHIDARTLEESLTIFFEQAAEARAEHPGSIDLAELHTTPKDIQSLAFLQNWLLRRALPMVLWICSEQPDYDRAAPTNPSPVKTKRGQRVFAASAPTIWEAGVRIGPALTATIDRKATDPELESPLSGGHRNPRPHLRRAHWHGYWTGPRDQDQAFKLHWLNPILVGADDIRTEDLPVTIRSVKI